MSEMNDSTERELQSLRARLEILESAVRQRPSRRPRFAAAAVLVAIVVGVAGVVSAANGNCPNGMPFCFSPDTPAEAAQVNHNFSQLKEWLESKVGPVTAPAISSSTGISSTGRITTSGGLSVTGGGVSVSNTDITLTNGRLIGTNTVGNFYIDTTGNALFLNWFSGNGVTFGNGAMGQAARVDNAGNMSVAGGMTVGNVGGNVPFSCIVRSATGTYNVGCAPNEIAVGGGGRCDSVWRLTESLPWGGNADNQPWVAGQPARGWRAVCQIWGNAGVYTPPQLGTFAICCRQ
jgi:hypothetical protein